MKKKTFVYKIPKFFAIIGCLVLAIMVWLVVSYAQIETLPISLSLG